MDRVTLRIPKQQIEEVEAMVEAGRFPNRSEAIRTAVRDMLNEHQRPRERRRTRTDGGTVSREKPLPGELGRSSYGGDCPACGGRYEGRLPDHLRKDCPETGGSR